MPLSTEEGWAKALEFLQGVLAETEEIVRGLDWASNGPFLSAPMSFSAIRLEYLLVLQIRLLLRLVEHGRELADEDRKRNHELSELAERIEHWRRTAQALDHRHRNAISWFREHSLELPRPSPQAQASWDVDDWFHCLTNNTVVYSILASDRDSVESAIRTVYPTSSRWWEKVGESTDSREVARWLEGWRYGIGLTLGDVRGEEREILAPGYMFFEEVGMRDEHSWSALYELLRNQDIPPQVISAFKSFVGQVEESWPDFSWFESRSTATADAPFNVIPGTGKGSCRELLVLVAKNDKEVLKRLEEGLKSMAWVRLEKSSSTCMTLCR